MTESQSLKSADNKDSPVILITGKKTDSFKERLEDEKNRSDDE